MIRESSNVEAEELRRAAYDVCLYALGFESRSTRAASLITAQHTIAIKMPEIPVHAYTRNVAFAHTRKHTIVTNAAHFFERGVAELFDSRKPVKVAFDISSLNRTMMFEALRRLALTVRSEDEVHIIYCPAVFTEPDWQFPQIEQLGPISREFAAFDADPLRPLCLILGLGFEAGVSMGIISQLEPQVSFCFWGSGVDERFDRAVKKANFDFEFTGFNTRSVSYPIRDPKSSFFLLENLTFGLLHEFNVVMVPMGPKIFALLTALVGLTHPGKFAVWRAQQRRATPPDAKPGKEFVVAKLDTNLLRHCLHRAGETIAAL